MRQTGAIRSHGTAVQPLLEEVAGRPSGRR